MSKLKIIDKKSIQSIKSERHLLSKLNHPFIVNMHFAFQDSEHLYLVIDLLTGGDLRYHICKHRRFNESQTQFFIACIIAALEYIHSKSIIHRDLKPENLVLDNNGYIHLTDFGIAKIYNAKVNNSHETSGTPGYMSPEVMKGQNHSYVVDYFALGVIGYELMMGRRPYVGKSRKEIKEQMLAKQAFVHVEEIPEGWSEEAVAFVNALLERKPERRLGFGGIAEVKGHEWLKGFKWRELEKKVMIAEFVPENKDNYDKKYCNDVEKIGVDTIERYEEYRMDSKFDELFNNFTYYSYNNRNTLSKARIKHKHSVSSNMKIRTTSITLNNINSNSNTTTINGNTKRIHTSKYTHSTTNLKQYYNTNQNKINNTSTIPPVNKQRQSSYNNRLHFRRNSITNHQNTSKLNISSSHVHKIPTHNKVTTPSSAKTFKIPHNRHNSITNSNSHSTNNNNNNKDNSSNNSITPLMIKRHIRRASYSNTTSNRNNNASKERDLVVKKVKYIQINSNNSNNNSKLIHRSSSNTGNNCKGRYNSNRSQVRTECNGKLPMSPKGRILGLAIQGNAAAADRKGKSNWNNDSIHSNSSNCKTYGNKNKTITVNVNGSERKRYVHKKSNSSNKKKGMLSNSNSVNVLFGGNNNNNNIPTNKQQTTSLYSTGSSSLGNNNCNNNNNNSVINPNNNV